MLCSLHVRSLSRWSISLIWSSIFFFLIEWQQHAIKSKTQYAGKGVICKEALWAADRRRKRPVQLEVGHEQPAPCWGPAVMWTRTSMTSEGRTATQYDIRRCVGGWASTCCQPTCLPRYPPRCDAHMHGERPTKNVIFFFFYLFIIVSSLLDCVLFFHLSVFFFVWGCYARVFFCCRQNF